MSLAPSHRICELYFPTKNKPTAAGGLAPLVATVLTVDVSRQAPGYILTLLAIIALTGLWVVAPARDTTHVPVSSTEMTKVHHGGDEESSSNNPDDDDDDDDNELL